MRTLIVNADDLGYAPGVSDGILAAHREGIVTSTSLMIRCPDAERAAADAAAQPALAVGLHLDLTSPWAAGVDRTDAVALRRELEGQLERFVGICGRPPTHLDGHHHVHREPEVLPHARELAALLGVHLRHEGPAEFIGDFDARPDWDVPADPARVSVEALLAIVDGMGDGIHELMCHPGRAEALDSGYAAEREWELATLTDPSLPAELARRGVRLASFRDFAA